MDPQVWSDPGPFDQGADDPEDQAPGSALITFATAPRLPRAAFSTGNDLKTS